MKIKKVLVYTGSRANYSSSRSIMKSINAHPSLELLTLVGGPGLLDSYGNVEGLMMEDGLEIDAKSHMIIEGELPLTMAKSAGLGIIECATIIDKLKPDVLLIVGDRFDIIAPVIAAAYSNIIIAHTMGGEVSGSIDESIRHAVTKFSHIHFPANKDAKERIIKMGEDPNFVFEVGCPRIDFIKENLDSLEDNVNTENFFKRNNKGVGEIFEIKENNFLLVSQHPVTTEFGKNRLAIEETLSALNEIQMPTIMIWPNADAGSCEVSKGIRTFREQYKPDWLHLFTNLPYEEYLPLMFKCGCMIGNSSSAVREGEYIGTPAVNIGSRQQDRMKGDNLLEVSSSKENIVKAVKKQLRHGRYNSQNLYGDGNAGNKIADIMAQLNITNSQKVITY